ncbi:T9SS type A sorting domain-containing protein [Lishizhenia sp.]|uniref:T9SS type A sorting domain-containing protein n=1 Tax=Lishizhenia sp. TaxID=2497594 RepID=UPI00299CFAAF|nr:T9SS type A sorting domain-containing protein [Lishizhenia sp.]MDX1445127.1 T9SS type A sorting domain-containing protein [Lishizhenia sp.]
MRIFKYLIPLIAILWTVGNCYAINYYSVQPGNYGNNATWTSVPVTNNAPPDILPFGDSVFISHELSHTKELIYFGVLVIESSGYLYDSKDVTIESTGFGFIDGMLDLKTNFFNLNETEVNGSIISLKKVENGQGATLNNNGYIEPRTFENYSTVNNNGEIAVTQSNGTFINHPDANLVNTDVINTACNLENNGNITNTGTVNASDDLTNTGNISSTGTVNVGVNMENSGTVQSSGTINVTEDYNNDGSTQNSGNITVTLDFFNNGTFINNGTVNILENLENSGTINNNPLGNITVTLDYANTGSLNNSGYLNANAITDEGYTCNSASIQVTQGNTYDCDGCTMTCGGSTTTCFLNLSGGAYIEEQNYCCQDNSNTAISTASPFLIDSATIFICGQPLPVELLSFSGKALKNGNNEITWVTATEMNNDYFLLEKSLDGTQWVTLEKVKGAGYSEQEISYTVVDETALLGVSYYRLKQVDYNGDHQYFGPISIHQKIGDHVLSTYPNPTKDILNVRSTKELTLSNFRFTSLSGKNIANLINLEEISSQHVRLNLAHLPDGVYLLQYGGEVHRIIKQ